MYQHTSLPAIFLLESNKSVGNSFMFEKVVQKHVRWRHSSHKQGAQNIRKQWKTKGDYFVFVIQKIPSRSFLNKTSEELVFVRCFFI